jgi:hypothetical protein
LETSTVKRRHSPLQDRSRETEKDRERSTAWADLGGSTWISTSFDEFFNGLELIEFAGDMERCLPKLLVHHHHQPES